MRVVPRILRLIAAAVVGLALGSAGAAIYNQLSPPPGTLVVTYVAPQPNTSIAQPLPFLGEGVYIAVQGGDKVVFERTYRPPVAGEVIAFLQTDGCPGCWGPFINESLRGASAAGVDRLYVVVCRSLSDRLDCGDPLALSVAGKYVKRVQLAGGGEVEIPPGAPNLAVEGSGAPLFTEYIASRIRHDPGYAARPLWASVAEYIASARTK